MPKEHISMRYLDKPREEWCRLEHRAIAKEVLSFLNRNFKNDLALELWDARTYDTHSYTCWWVSLKDANTYKEKNGLAKLCIALNFNLFNNNAREDAEVGFRFMTIVRRDDLGLIGWKTDNRYFWLVPFKENKGTLPRAMLIYLKSFREHFNNGNLPNFNNFIISNVAGNVQCNPERI
jgi:hypothetical protein